MYGSALSAPANALFDRLLAAHLPEILDLYAKWPGETAVLRPTIVRAEFMRRLYDAALVVGRAVQDAARALAADESLRREIGVPRHLEGLLAIDEGNAVPSLMVRLDGFVDVTGRVRFCELNPRPSLFESTPAIAAAFAELPISREIARTCPFRTEIILDRLHEAVSAECGSGLVLAMMPCPEDDMFARHLAAHGFRVLQAAPGDLRVRGDRLHCGDVPVDLVDLPVSLFADETADLSGVTAALRRRLARPFFGHTYGVLALQKSIFEVLSSPMRERIFDADTTRTLEEHVPWTRHVRERKTDFRGREIDLLPFVLEHRESLVLKPVTGYSGHGVVIGRRVDAATWEQALRRGKARGLVVQERIDMAPMACPILVDGKVEDASVSWDINPHVWGAARFAQGCFSRISRSEITNTHAGEGPAPAVWIVDD